MNELMALVKRNCKLFFKDKGMFFSSLITPLILLILYVAFLGNVYRSTFAAYVPAETPETLMNAIVSGQLLSSILAVSCVTVAFCSNLLMVQDKVTEARKDLMMAPVKKSTMALGYYLATVITTLIVCVVALACCLIYAAFTGWYMSFGDILFLLLDTFLLVMFGTALSSIIHFFLNTQGQMSAVGTIVSCAYGFLCGAYMPISQFGSGLQKVLMFLPGTYGTSLVRNHSLNGVLDAATEEGWPMEVVDGIRDSIDCNIYFFGNKVEVWALYLVIIGSVVGLILVYVLLNVYKKKRVK